MCFIKLILTYTAKNWKIKKKPESKDRELAEETVTRKKRRKLAIFFMEYFA